MLRPDSRHVLVDAERPQILSTVVKKTTTTMTASASIGTSATSPHRLAIWKRPADLFYFLFFAMHLFASLCVDIQGLVPATYVPKVFRNVLADYLTKSRDPLVPNTWLPRYAWFRMSLLSEFMLQVPAFLVGLYAFWYNDARAYPFLIAYGAIACFTTLQCIAMVTIGEERVHLSEANLLFILQNYIPFMMIPGVLMIDMIVRTTRRIHTSHRITNEHRKTL